MSAEDKTPAQVAHDAFDHLCQPDGAEPGEYTNEWDKVDPKLQAAWKAAADAVIDQAQKRIHAKLMEDQGVRTPGTSAWQQGLADAYELISGD